MHIDWWTLALQTVNVLIFIWILGRFFFRPVTELVAKRKEATSRLLADADQARKDAEGLRAEAARVRTSIDAERDRLIREAHKAADTEKAALLADLSTELEHRRSDATVEIAKERAAMQRAVVDHASELSVDIARKLLKKLPPETAFSAFLNGLSTELGRLSAELRNSLARATPDRPLRVLAATPLAEEQQLELRAALGTALGVDPPLEFCSDQALIAGLEIQGRNVIVRNNWQADLALIRKELEQ